MRVSIRVAAIGLTLAACSSSDTNAPRNTAPLTQADAQVIGDEMQTEVAAFSSGGSLPDLMSCRFGFFPGALRLFHGPIRFGNPPAGCPTLDPATPADADGDGIPDILTLSFNPATCTFTRPGGEATMELSGSVTISDPSQTPPANGLHLHFEGLQQKVTLLSSDYFLRKVNGDWQLTSDATGFEATEQTTVRHESSSHPTSDLGKIWNVVFTAEAPATFSPHEPLPSGDFLINGSTTRTRDAVTRTFQIETVTPLHRDVSCTEDNRFVSGELKITTTNTSGTQTVDIIFNPCGQDPTVTLVT
jgi:hypothetical protein